MIITYKRPSGSLIEVSDTPENRAYAEAQGWAEVKEKEEKPKPKRATK